ncbi:2-octaprenyl-6-methoxyphenyl hydroxylase [Alkalimarinus sediminis]|uniref:2-octaprenyl-6-methoxyphenyl hydroxylase n=1 Tax=Alkalimarinus sediminis TaxID=1632866 RepID=A0A9E8KQ69_9ALTE|nr:2-octaprenyl-6-methoxyphenyl hydroxylase [Alkalimarinus sediminis]UZW74332.1 2-octaprenyl-6-methoxyphenyl hydroxylase [Alkalimarinus sediminis]
MNSHYDVVIIGGGMVGASLAVALKNTKLNIAVIEPYPISSGEIEREEKLYQPSYDARSTALSWGSRLIYQQLGLWQKLSLHATPIKKIHVSDRGRFGATRLDADSYRVEALGYVVPNEWIGKTLVSGLNSHGNIDFICPAKVEGITRTESATCITLSKRNDETGDYDLAEETVTADLVVIADGGRSETCQKLGIEMQTHSYGQHALVTNVTTSKHHGYEAFERFTESGPMAMLPLGAADNSAKNTALNPTDSRCALVWTLPEDQVEDVMAMSDSEFMALLQDRFGYRLGQIEQVGVRHHYPLKLSQSAEQVRAGIVVVGNAAHALHPVAGQGYNLALRGVLSLAELIVKAANQDEPIGSLTVLQRYIEDRYVDQDKTILFSDKITRLFGDTNTGVGLLRDMGLIGLDILPGAKRFFARQAMGLGGSEAKIL